MKSVQVGLLADAIPLALTALLLQGPAEGQEACRLPKQSQTLTSPAFAGSKSPDVPSWRWDRRGNDVESYAEDDEEESERTPKGLATPDVGTPAETPTVEEAVIKS